MKFAKSLIILAVAVSINASTIPLGLTTLQAAGIPTVISAGPSAIPAGIAISSAPGSLAISSSLGGNVIAGPAAIQLATSPAAIQLATSPAAIQLATSQAAIQLAAPSPVIIAASGPATYTAANRGTVHVSELPGHIVSKASLNLQPAPGTI